MGRYHVVLALAALLISCNTKKYLQADEVLLVKNKVVVYSKEMSTSEKNVLRYELQTQIKQQPNDRSLIFFKPRLWFYYRQLEKGDSTDFDRFAQRRLAEPPSLYNKDLAYESQNNMEELIFNKGYLESEVWLEDTVIDQKAFVTYYVKPNRLYRVDKFDVLAPDSAVSRIVSQGLNESYLKPGKPVSNILLNQEKQRIIAALHQEGYADFSYSNFGKLEATDTTGGLVDMRLPILPNQNNQLERKFVGNIRVNNRSQGDAFKLAMGSMYDSIYFVGFDRRNSVKPTTLLKYIELRPGSLYQKSDLSRTRTQLQLPAIQFADIRPTERKDGSNIVDFEIDILSAKRIETDLEFEFNRTTVSSESFIGIGSSVSLINNNFLGGSERLSNGLDVNFEIDPDLSSVFNAANINFYNTLEIPRFADFFKLHSSLQNSRLFNQTKYGAFISNANTIFDIGYEYVDLFNFFNYHSLTAEYGFRGTIPGVKSRKRIEIIHPSITYFNPTIRAEFDSLYSEQTFARKSFGPQLFTGVLFNRFTQTIERVAGIRGFSSALIADFELSGLEVYLVNLAVNGLKEPFKLGSLTFAHFARMELDGRLYKQLNSDQVLAFRANFGIAVPFGPSTFIPYVKQFYLGGPLSMRAWRIRELGPGAFQDPNASRSNGTPFFQAADLKILLNAEYRFDIFWRIEGAFFVDAGNVWSLQKDERDGGVFSTDFLKQMAVGSGGGMRFDADYFKVVLDVGVKVRNPFPNEDGQYGAWRDSPAARDVLNWNFAINYPF